MAIIKNLLYFGRLKFFVLLRYFRINDPYRLLGLLAIMAVIYVPLFIDTPPLTFPELKSVLIGKKVHEGYSLYTGLIDSTGPLAGWLYGLFDILFDESLLARHIFAFFILFFQAAYLGFIFIDKKAFTESSFVPSLLYVVIFFFTFDALSLTAEILGLSFLLLALNSLYKEIEFREERNETVLSLGLFIGLASLFEFSFAMYLFAGIVILAIYTRNSARKFLLMLVGFLLPHLLLLCLYFMKDGVHSIIHHFYLPNLTYSSERYVGSKSLLILGAVPVIYLVISMIMLNRETRFTKYQSQLFQAMFFWMVFSFLQILYSKNLTPQSFITLVPSFCFFISHFFLMIQRKRLAERSLWILVIGMVTITYLARYGRVSTVDYSPLLVRENSSGNLRRKKIVVLEDDLSLYHNNVLSTPFLSWKLSKEIFENPEYYENVIAVYNGFKADPPDIIIDRKKYMRGFFERIPDLQKQYKPTEIGYQRISN